MNPCTPNRVLTCSTQDIGPNIGLYRFVSRQFLTWSIALQLKSTILCMSLLKHGTSVTSENPICVSNLSQYSPIHLTAYTCPNSRLKNIDHHLSLGSNIKYQSVKALSFTSNKDNGVTLIKIHPSQY